MKKVIKKVTSKVTASATQGLPEPTGTGELVCKCKKVEKLETSFGNGEVNQVVEKLNEVIEVLNKCQ